MTTGAKRPCAGPTYAASAGSRGIRAPERRPIAPLWVVASLVVTRPARADVPRPAPAAPLPALIAPRLTSGGDVAYPAGAHGDAAVTLLLVIEKDGSVSDARALAGDEPFASASAAAARAWAFAPATRDGHAVVARIRFEVNFRGAVVPEAPPSAPPPVPSAPSAPGATTPRPHLAPRPDDQVVISGERHAPGVVSLSRAEARQVPGAFGDPLRAIDILPGVTPVVSGLPYFFVRGAPPGDVGYFLDGVRVPALYHVLVGPSVVNPALVDRADLYAGGYPARFGRFTGGIVSAETTPPAREAHGEGNVRLFDAGGLVESPLDGGRATVLAGGRYSYAGPVISLFSKGTTLGYWDYQTRATFDLTPDDRIGVFAFGSSDVLRASNEGVATTLDDTTFHRVDLRYEHRGSGGARLRYDLVVGLDLVRSDVDALSSSPLSPSLAVGGPEDLSTITTRTLESRVDYAAKLSDHFALDTGADLLVEGFHGQIGTPAAGPSNTDALLGSLFSNRTDLTFGAWLEVPWRPSPRFEMTPGLRADFYSSRGVSAISLDPRLSTRTRVADHVQFVTTFGSAHQTPSFLGPVPGLDQLAGLRGGLQQSVQESGGVELELPAGVAATATLFHSTFFNMTDTLGGISPGGVSLPGRVDERFLGSSEGLELLVRRSLTRRLGGFFSYTLSHSDRRYGAEAFTSAFDRTHVLNAAIAYDLGRAWRAGTRFVFYTGTPPNNVSAAQVAEYHIPGRLPPFYRLDLRLEKRWSAGPRWWWALVFEVQNVTLDKEVIDYSCPRNAPCGPNAIGPVTIPSIGLEGGFR